MHEALLKAQIEAQESLRRRYLDLEAYRKYGQALDQVLEDVLPKMPATCRVVSAIINDYSTVWTGGVTYLYLTFYVVCDSPKQLVEALDYLSDGDPDNIKVTANSDGSATYEVAIRQPDHKLVWFLNIQWSPSQQSTCELVIVGTRTVEKGTTVTVSEPIYEVRCKA